jgi:hypothetical protein
MNDNNKQQDARSLNSISTATSPESLSFLENKRNAGQHIDHPPDIASIQCKRNQEIKDEFYKHVNGFYDNYVGTKQMWNAVLIGGIVPTGEKMEMIEPTIVSFLDTYAFLRNMKILSKPKSILSTTITMVSTMNST